MLRSTVLVCLAVCVVIEARPKWQHLPPLPGYVPVYIQSGDTPLDQINPELAEAFHVLPAGRSANKPIDAVPEELEDQPREETPVSAEDSVDHRPYAKKLLEKKKKVNTEVIKPIERR